MPFRVRLDERLRTNPSAGPILLSAPLNLFNKTHVNERVSVSFCGERHWHVFYWQEIEGAGLAAERTGVDFINKTPLNRRWRLPLECFHIVDIKRDFIDGLHRPWRRVGSVENDKWRRISSFICRVANYRFSLPHRLRHHHKNAFIFKPTHRITKSFSLWWSRVLAGNKVRFYEVVRRTEGEPNRNYWESFWDQLRFGSFPSVSMWALDAWVCGAEFISLFYVRPLVF